MKSKPLNLFYQEPSPDRWLPYDHLPRKLVRELLYITGVRRRRPSGQRMVYQNLKRSLKEVYTVYRKVTYAATEASSRQCKVRFHRLREFVINELL